MHDLSVLILAKNEAENLSLLIPQLHNKLNDKKISYEILIIIPHNENIPYSDETGKLKYIKENQKGYGNALRQGLALCQGDFVITVDADLSHPVNYIDSLWQLRNSADLIVCSRYIKGGKAHMPFIRKISSTLLNFMFCLTLRLPINDISSGYRLYKRHSIEKITLKSNNFDILIEIAIKLFINDRVVIEIPFEYMPRENGISKARLFMFAFSYIKTYFALFLLRYFKIDAFAKRQNIGTAQQKAPKARRANTDE